MTVGFLDGCFDILVPGHLDIFEAAKRYCDHLIVCIASNDTIRQLKREPILREEDRLRLIRAVRYVDEAFICRGETGSCDSFPYVKNIRPDIWFTGDDDKYIEEKKVLMEAHEGKVMILARYPNAYSTTKVLEAIRRTQ